MAALSQLLTQMFNNTPVTALQEVRTKKNSLQLSAVMTSEAAPLEPKNGIAGYHKPYISQGRKKSLKLK